MKLEHCSRASCVEIIESLQKTLGSFVDRRDKDEELLRQAFDAIVNVLAGADYDDPYASLKEAAKALSDRLGGGLK
jgi:hypothetical protein